MLPAFLFNFQNLEQLAISYTKLWEMMQTNGDRILQNLFVSIFQVLGGEDYLTAE